MKKKVLVGGCFDILHYGHVEFLKQAKKLGDVLIVALESDQNTKRLKGKKRPIHTQTQRAEILMALEHVDEVIPLTGIPTDQEYNELILKIRPDIIATTKGDPILLKKKEQAKMVGGKVIEIPQTKVNSTSQIAKLLKVE